MKDNKEIAEFLEERFNGDIEVKLFENPSFANAFIGLSHNDRAVYDYDLMLQTDEFDSPEEAAEWIDYNTLRAMPYEPNAPIILYRSDYWED